MFLFTPRLQNENYIAGSFVYPPYWQIKRVKFGVRIKEAIIYCLQGMFPLHEYKPTHIHTSTTSDALLILFAYEIR